MNFQNILVNVSILFYIIIQLILVILFLFSNMDLSRGKWSIYVENIKINLSIPSFYWEIYKKNDMNLILTIIRILLKSNNISMSQIIEFEYKFLSKLIKMSNKIWEKRFKKERKKVKSLLANQGNKNNNIKKNQESIFRFERRGCSKVDLLNSIS